MISFVTFERPFRLAGVAEEQPEGTYAVRRDQDTPDMMTPAGWWQTAITMEIRRGGATQRVAIDGRDLRDALDRDQAGPGWKASDAL